jgi:hypothetical protein
MKIVIAVKRSESIDSDDVPLLAALAEAFGAKTDETNTIVVVSIGSSSHKNQLVFAVQNGANKGIQVVTQDSLSAYTVAECLTDIVRNEKPELVIISNNLTSEQCQTGKILSSMLSESFPIKNCRMDRNQYRLLVIREMLSGAHTVLLPITPEASIEKRPWYALGHYQEITPLHTAAYPA